MKKGCAEGVTAMGPLEKAAGQVQRRLGWVGAANHLLETSPWVAGGLVLALLGNLGLNWGWPAGGLLVGVLVLWLGWLAVRLVRRWPGEQEALLIWDATTGRKGALASAWEWEGRGAKRVGEQLHYEASLAILDVAMSRLEEDFPWPRPDWRWAALPAALVVLGVFGLREHREEMVARMGGEEQARQAIAQAETVRRVAEAMTELSGDGLAGAEEAVEVVAALEETAKRMASGAESGKGDLPGELEERARSLEEYAEGLGEGDSQWASEEFIRALVGQSDTGKLGEAMQDRDAERGERETGVWAQRLRSEPGTGSFGERLGRALRRAVAAATEEDGNRILVQFVADAAGCAEEGDYAAAAEAAEAMAAHFRRLAQTRAAQSRMEQLVEDLRRAGSEIAGSGVLAPLASGPAVPEGAHPLSDHEPLTSADEVGETREPSGETTGEGEGPKGDGEQMVAQGAEAGDGGAADEGAPLQAPVPGMAPEPPAGAPGLSAPVPGGADTRMAQLARQMGGEGTAAPGVPGMDAGFGRSEMREGEASAFRVEREDQVEAHRGEAGEALVREIEGSEARSERAQAAEPVEANFGRVEEAVRRDQELPASRRGQVERYFRGLRQSGG